MVTAPDDFWVPGRGVLGEVPVALGSFDILVVLDSLSERQDETGLCGPRPENRHSPDTVGQQLQDLRESLSKTTSLDGWGCGQSNGQRLCSLEADRQTPDCPGLEQVGVVWYCWAQAAQDPRVLSGRAPNSHYTHGDVGSGTTLSMENTQKGGSGPFSRERP